MTKVLKNKTFLILLFLALFGFSVGLFDNYRELWMAKNNLSTIAISHVISISCIVTVFVLVFFTIKISPSKLKKGILSLLGIKTITSIILLFLNNTNQLFWIKLIMFFDIASAQTIVASIYPLMMNIEKDDILYTKKSVVESISNKLGFLLVSFFIGKTVFSKVFDYNTCLLLSVLFTIFSLIILGIIKLKIKKDTNELFELKETIIYFRNNLILYKYLLVDLIGNLIWYVILGMPLLLLTSSLKLSSSIASYIILGFGILSNFLAIIIVKKLHSRNDHINLFVKYGIRIILFILVFFTNNKIIFIISLIYLLLTDCTHNFIFNGFFINHIDEKYALVLTTLKYCTSLTGKAIGTFICGLVLNLDFRFLVFPALIIAIVHYVIATILIKEKNEWKVIE